MSQRIVDWLLDRFTVDDSLVMVQLAIYCGVAMIVVGSVYPLASLLVDRLRGK